MSRIVVKSDLLESRGNGLLMPKGWQVGRRLRREDIKEGMYVVGLSLNDISSCWCDTGKNGYGVVPHEVVEVIPRDDSVQFRNRSIIKEVNHTICSCFDRDRLYEVIIPKGEQQNNNSGAVGSAAVAITKTVMSIKLMLKKALSPSLKKLIKTGFLNEDLSLTQKGRETLEQISFEKNIKEMEEVADEEIAESNK